MHLTRCTHSELLAGELVFREWRARRNEHGLRNSLVQYASAVVASLVTLFVTPKGVQPPAVCDASATREGL